MTSDKKQLIWNDIKSSLVSFGLVASPIIIVELMNRLSSMESNIWIEMASLGLGLILKLIQKWSQATTY